jgi:hypothetical protein
MNPTRLEYQLMESICGTTGSPNRGGRPNHQWSHRKKDEEEERNRGKKERKKEEEGSVPYFV